MTLADLKATAEAQDAYGKWNTAPAWNRYHAAKRAAHPIRSWLVDHAILAAGWALFAFTIGRGFGWT